MSFFKVVRGKADRLRDRLRSSSLLPIPQAGSLQPQIALVPGAAIINNTSNVNHNAPGGTIVNNNSVTNVVSRDKAAEDLDTIEKGLGQHRVSRALYDAQPLTAGCMEGTRVELLENIKNFLISRGGAHIVWIAGMVGTGKTSIALTICRLLVKIPEVLLGGSFFCSRSAGMIDRTDAHRIIPTLALLLARQVSSYARALAAELKDDPELGHKAISVQIEHLLVRPLESVGDINRQIVFVIDALDECSDQERLAELVNGLADLNSPAPVKFLFTSRPEMHIRETLISDTSLSSIVQLHLVDETLVTADIRLYIQRTFEKSSATSIWYTEADLDNLAALSASLFIYASTALAYILKRRDIPGRAERLRAVMAQTSTSALAVGALDKMYSLVMMQASDPEAYEGTEVDETRRIVAVILSTRSPLTVRALAELLGISPERLRGALDGIHAVIFVPEQDDEGELRALHASFGDFMFNRSPKHIRIGRYFGDEEIAKACLHRMAADDLCFNVSHSRSSYESNPKTKPDWIAHALIYSCLHWAYHIATSRLPSDDSIDSVFRPKLLFWLEVLSVIGEVGRASGLLRAATESVISPDISQFLRDANSFVAFALEAIDRSPPHIYISALNFEPKSSLVYRTFSLLLTGLPEIETFGIDHNDGRCVTVLAGHNDGVTAIARSSDGQLLASGSRDKTVRVWDTNSGVETRSPLVSNDGKILSVAFIPDGDRLVAGTSNGSVLAWDAKTGQLILDPLRLHTDYVRAVAVSPDGETIASASDDSTVALCHPNASQPLGIVLGGHEDWVYAVSFAPDRPILASGGRDGTIRLWDYRLGHSHGEPLGGGQDPVFCIDFSPDGLFMASGGNTLVRVWDALSHQQLHAYSGHQGEVMSVRFAPGGSSLASASEDLTVRIWNLRNTNLKTASLVLRGHSESANAISFSKDGHYVISGSDDRTIRVWDASEDSIPDLPMNEQIGKVHAVSLSHDGRLIASASADGLARVWNVETYQQMYTPLIGHEGPIYAVEFSLDGRWIATGSGDKTLRLWDAQTGQSAAPEFRGHTGDVDAISFSPSSLYIASGSDDATVCVWEVSTEHPKKATQIQCPQRILSVAYSPGGGHIAAGDFRGDVRIYDALTGLEVSVFRGRQARPVRSLAFSPDGAQIKAAVGRLITHIDVQRKHGVMGRQVKAVEYRTANRDVMTFGGDTDDVNAVAYSPDGQCIAVGVDDWTFCLCNQNTNKEQVLYGHAGAVSSVVISSDGRFAVTGSKDKTVRLWNLDKIKSSADKRDRGPLASLSRYEKGWLVSPSGELLLWVPVQYRGYLEIDGYSRVISTHRAVITAKDGLLHQGEQWTRCWRSRDAFIS